MVLFYTGGFYFDSLTLKRSNNHKPTSLNQITSAGILLVTTTGDSNVLVKLLFMDLFCVSGSCGKWLRLYVPFGFFSFWANKTLALGVFLPETVVALVVVGVHGLLLGDV